MKELKYKATLNGTKGTQVKWLIDINGQQFDYFEGVGRFLTWDWSSRRYTDEAYANIAHLIATKEDRNNISRSLWQKNTRGTKRCKVRSYLNDTIAIVAVKPPELDDVLSCLVEDARALEMCFDDWVDDYGFNSDSIQDKAIYDVCVSNGHKLRKAGVNIHMERAFLQEM